MNAFDDTRRLNSYKVGRGVDRVLLPYYYNLGAALGKLAAFPISPPPGTDDSFTVWRVGSDVHSLLAWLYGTGGPLRAPMVAHDFLSLLTRYGDTIGLTPNVPAQPEQTPDARTALLVKSWDLQAVVLADLQRLPVYSVPKQGIYDTDSLIEQAEFDIPEEYRIKLKPTTLADVQEAGRCLAFGVPTAAGFHIMRAVEDVLADYCDTVEIDGAKGVPLKKPGKSKNWGDYTTYLKRSEEPDVVQTHALLEPLGKYERNEIMHPERVLTENEAFRLFKEGQTAIERMAVRIFPKIVGRDVMEESRQKKREILDRVFGANKDFDERLQKEGVEIDYSAEDDNLCITVGGRPRPSIAVSVPGDPYTALFVDAKTFRINAIEVVRLKERAKSDEMRPTTKMIHALADLIVDRTCVFIPPSQEIERAEYAIRGLVAAGVG